MTAQEKEFLHKLKDEYYGKKKPRSKDNPPLTVTTKSGTTEPSRAYLMAQAKVKGIRNFRVLNKAELAECMTIGTTQERINEIVAGAVTRWKAGWGKRGAK